MPNDVFGWVLAVYWPLCFLGAIGLTIAFVKPTAPRVLMAVGFGVLLAVVVLQRLFWVFAVPTDGGDLRVPSELLTASTTVFGLGDLIGYILILLSLVVVRRR